MKIDTQAQELRWLKHKLGSGGDICLVDWMGSDDAIVQAARISYGSGTKKTRADENLIRHLMRHRHTSPFEMCELKFRIRIPMDTWRQWIRHRTASVNEYSTRYSIAIDEMLTTPPDKWRLQDPGNKQGSDGYLGTEDGGILSQLEASFQRDARFIYDTRIEAGVAREQARKDLPLSTYTEAYWKIDLHNLLHFLSLRMDGHAQEEIREFANVIGHCILSVLFPVTWEAWQDYVFEAMTLTRLDQLVVQEINRMIGCGLGYEGAPPVSLLSFHAGCLVIDRWKDLKDCRERDECLVKMRRLGLVEM